MPDEKEFMRIMQLTPQIDPYAKVADIAARLGVEPCEHADYGITLADGRLYDVYALINALLDRIDGALKDA